MSTHDERCKECKQRVLELLIRGFGEVSANYDLQLPARLQDYGTYNVFDALGQIHQRLQNYRGFSIFVRATRLPKVDFYVHHPGFVLEFDESQHFTRPRWLALDNYPDDFPFGYSKSKWSRLARELDRKDRYPPYRDEQRAWYDTLRDFSALVCGHQSTVRLYSRDLAWCSLDPGNIEDVERFMAFVRLPQGR